MYSLDNGSRFVIPRTELTFPAHMMRMHANAAAAGSMFVYHGSRKAVLINYPEQNELKNIFKYV